MAKGYSLHIGIKRVAPVHYNGWAGFCSPCEEDAKAMYELAQARHFDHSELMLTHEATREAFVQSMIALAEKSTGGDIVFLSFSGHGGQILDENHDEKEGKDETWCLYDGPMVDDQIYQLLLKFQKGVRVLVMVDSCHSGTSIREDETLFSEGLFLPQKAKPKNPEASIRLLASCQDDETAKSGTSHSQFTKTMLEVWDEGRFVGNYEQFVEKITSKMPFGQNPNHFVIGKPDTVFSQQAPFTI